MDGNLLQSKHSSFPAGGIRASTAGTGTTTA